MEVPRQEAAIIKVSGSPDFAWDMAVKTLPNAHGLDGELVYTQSPRVIANTKLSMELAYVPIGGEEEAVLEDELPEGIHEVLPADAFEDPWVGRYRFTLYKDEELVDIQYLNFAESLHMRARTRARAAPISALSMPWATFRRLAMLWLLRRARLSRWKRASASLARTKACARRPSAVRPAMS